MIVLNILVRLETWQIILTTVASSLTALVSIYASVRIAIRRIQVYVQAATEAVDRRRHDDLVAVRNDILTALDQVTPGVGKFEQVKEGDLGSSDVTGYRST